MKIRTTILAILIVIGLLLTNFSSALALPPLPSGFYGKVKSNGGNVPVGIPVTAFINGVQYAFTGSILYQSETIYSLVIPGDDPTTPVIEGGVVGDTIVFQVNGLPADQTAHWQGGTNIMLDLTLAPQNMLFIPAIYKIE
jgi:hypothetical protein